MLEIQEILAELVDNCIVVYFNNLGGENEVKQQISRLVKEAAQQQRERVEKHGVGLSIFIKSVRGMMHALALDRPDIELIGDYGMLGIHNIRAVNESLAALKELEAE